ncbi:MAG: hypothetical protein ACI4Q7_00925, partial [Candidatus Avelusimicrobium sp.]
QLGVRKTLRLVEFVKHYETIYLTCEPKWDIVNTITHKIEKQKVSVLKSEVTKLDNVFHVSIVATFTGHEFQNITKELLEMPEVHSLYK